MDAKIFLAELRAHREKLGLSRSELASGLGSSELAIKRLEAGQGSTALLVQVMEKIEFHVAGLGRGWALNEQLRATRLRKKLSIAELSRRTSLSRQAIADVEAGRGSVRSILRVLESLGTGARTQQPTPRPSWANDPQGQPGDVRFTPPAFLKVLRDVFGEIDLDPCGHALSHVASTRTIELANGGDGLVDEWSGSFCFMNPPFSQMLKWLRRAEEQWRFGNVDKVLALVPARLDSPWVHDHLAQVADIWVLRGRLRFWTDTGPGAAATFAAMVVLMGFPPAQISEFTSRVAGNWFAPRTQAC